MRLADVRRTVIALAVGLWALGAAAEPPTPKPSPRPSALPGGRPPVMAAPTPPPAPPAPPVAAGDTEYRVGAGDVLDVTVFGNDDLSRTTTVQTGGTIALPLLGEVPVAELTVPEIKRKLTTLLARDYLVNPQVEVKVREYQSQSVTVLGEINAPGRKPLRGRTRLIDVLVEAGGFTPRASGEVLISRSDGQFESGERLMRVRLSSSTPSPQDQINLELRLRNGDIVTASPKYYVTVEGEVQRPGRYVLELDLTVTGAISTAGGLTRFGASDVKLRRVDPRTGQVQILTVDLKDVRKGKRPDVPLQANDVISVPKRLF
jgi:polysaccharide export outer membrane protein